MDTKALRQKILDLAIRGKLVPQDPNDEPASVLLERIREEKLQMVADGRLKKKDIKNDTIIYRDDDNLHYEKFQDGTVKCIEDEIPFEVPEGWEWCRLQSVCSVLTDGTHKTPIYSTEGYTFLSSKNVTSGKIDWENVMYIPEYLHQELYTRLAPQINDILLAKNGTTGIAALVDKEACFDIYVSLALIRIVNNIIAPEYVLNVIGSTYLQEYFKSSLKGIGVPNLHLEQIRRSLIPIPPYKKQKQINSICNELIQKTINIQNSKEDLHNLINIIKTKILNLAIQGKLVPQNPNDEPASVLLERIRSEKEELIKAGKIKRNKKESIIYQGDDNSYYEHSSDGIVRNIDDEIPFNVPSIWCWCRLRHIGYITSGGTPKTSESTYWDGNIPWLSPADLSNYDNKFISKGSRCITELGLKKSSAQLIPKGSILYSSRAPIGYIAIAKNEITTNQGFKSVTPYKNIFNEYIYYVLMTRTPDIVLRATGTTFKEISRSQFGETLVPIPPYNEQIHIAKKVDYLLNKISKIEGVCEEKSVNTDLL